MKDKEIKLKQDPKDLLITIIATRIIDQDKLSRRQRRASYSTHNFTVNELNEIVRLAKEKGLVNDKEKQS